MAKWFRLIVFLLIKSSKFWHSVLIVHFIGESIKADTWGGQKWRGLPHTRRRRPESAAAKEHGSLRCIPRSVSLGVGALSPFLSIGVPGLAAWYCPFGDLLCVKGHPCPKVKNQKGPRERELKSPLNKAGYIKVLFHSLTGSHCQFNLLFQKEKPCQSCCT